MSIFFTDDEENLRVDGNSDDEHLDWDSESGSEGEGQEEDMKVGSDENIAGQKKPSKESSDDDEESDSEMDTD